jgi:hypothetical protein
VTIEGFSTRSAVSAVRARIAAPVALPLRERTKRRSRTKAQRPVVPKSPAALIATSWSSRPKLRALHVTLPTRPKH